MTRREELSREMEERLYAYAFDANASHAFRGFNDLTRTTRFREHYAGVLQKALHEVFPRFAEQLEQLSPALVAQHRIELRPDASPRVIADHFVTQFGAYVEGHPKAALLRELLRLERAAFLARREEQFPLSVLLERLEAFAVVDLMNVESIDFHGLYYCKVWSSLPESLAMPSRQTPLLAWSVRLPMPRHCITYSSSVDGALHRKCAETFEELRAEMAAWSRGVDC